MNPAVVPEHIYIAFDDATGTVKGAHWSRLVGMKDEYGKWVGVPNIEGPLPVALKEGEQGTPWAEIEGMLDAAVLAGVEALRQEVADLKTLLDTEQKRAASAEAVADGLRLQLTRLQAEQVMPALGVLRSSMLGGHNV